MSLQSLLTLFSNFSNNSDKTLPQILENYLENAENEFGEAEVFTTPPSELISLCKRQHRVAYEKRFKERVIEESVEYGFCIPLDEEEGEWIKEYDTCNPNAGVVKTTLFNGLEYEYLECKNNNDMCRLMPIEFCKIGISYGYLSVDPNKEFEVLHIHSIDENKYDSSLHDLLGELNESFELNEAVAVDKSAFSQHNCRSHNCSQYMQSVSRCGSIVVMVNIDTCPAILNHLHSTDSAFGHACVQD
jgi:hypothetical protein